ncbi:putative cyclic-nucleotide-gated cation channel [Schistosoma mansoni]|uniref:putative cyclic-nucleotide-gated cation channel n=1 Tax=Schistosoma mansoni TaxID=6183 RepID=UPI0001A630BD|nr:putative cyclic-nucleotide-gated cation channel [Schistosoma mansoni]|eukprot:XP_018652319.1 putative cyclic-nucleotide-gated cation channel [Schistosoma mansoni]
MTTKENPINKPNSLLNIQYSHDNISQKSISDNETILLDCNNISHDQKLSPSSKINKMDQCKLPSKQYLNIHSNYGMSLSKLDKITRSSMTKLNKIYYNTQNNIQKSSSNDNASRRWKKVQCTMKVVLSSMDHVKLKLSMALLYNLWTPIARQAFDELQLKYQTIWLSFDILTDIIYLIDIFIQCNTSYLKCGLKVKEHQKLLIRYMKSYKFLLDITSLLPLDLLQFKVGIQPMLRFPRFLKWYRYYEWKLRVENRTIFPNIWRVLNLIHILFLGCHWFAAFYYLISKYEGFKNPWGYQPYNDAEQVTMSRRYLKSFYWATLTLTTIGDLSSPSSSIEIEVENVTLTVLAMESLTYNEIDFDQSFIFLLFQVNRL